MHFEIKMFLHYTTVRCVTLVDSAALLRIQWVVLCSHVVDQTFKSELPLVGLK